MSILQAALNNIDLEEIKRECTPTCEVKPERKLKHRRLGRPKNLSFKTKKGFTNEIYNRTI
jgi:hypothetical protein